MRHESTVKRSLNYLIWSSLFCFLFAPTALAEVKSQKSEVPQGYNIKSQNLAQIKGFGIGAGVFVVGERQGDTDNTFTISAYDRVDALLYYRQNNWQAQLNIENLFNENYIESADGFVTFGAPFIVRGQLSAEF